MSESFTLKSVTVTPQEVSNLLCSAWEGGSAYWATCESTVEPNRWEFDSDSQYTGSASHYSFDYPLNPGGAAIIRDTYGDEGTKVLDRAAVQKGLALLAEKHPLRFARMLAEDADAEDGDVFLQLCLFGDVIYG